MRSIQNKINAVSSTLFQRERLLCKAKPAMTKKMKILPFDLTFDVSSDVQIKFRTVFGNVMLGAVNCRRFSSLSEGGGTPPPPSAVRVLERPSGSQVNGLAPR